MNDIFNEMDDDVGIEMRHIPPPKSNVPAVAPHHLLPPTEEENILRRSLKEIGEDMKKMEDLITLTEDIIRRERERDKELYIRERRRKLSENPSIPRHLFQIQSIDFQRRASHDPQATQDQSRNLAIPLSNSPPPQHPIDLKSPMSFRKRLTKRFKRKSIKSDKRKNSVSESSPKPTKSPTLKVNAATRKLIRFSPRKYGSRLTFRNGKIGCIDAENVNANQTNVEKTHAIVNYITSELSYPAEGKRTSVVSNISDILSEQSSPSLNDLPNNNSYFNFDCSATESDDRGMADDDFCVNSLSEIESFTVHAKADDEPLVLEPADESCEVIEGAIEQLPDEEKGTNDAMPNEPTSAEQVTILYAASTLDSTLVNFEDETAGKSNCVAEEKAPPSAMSNHSNATYVSTRSKKTNRLIIVVFSFRLDWIRI